MKANNTLYKEVLGIMDNHHCIVTDELGKNCAKELVALIQRKQLEARIEEAKNNYSGVIKVIRERQDDPELHWQEIANPIVKRLAELEELKGENNG
jgi:hypothetical protein